MSVSSNIESILKKISDNTCLQEEFDCFIQHAVSILEENDIEKVIEAFKKNTSIKEINLACHKREIDELYYIFDILKTNETINKLSLNIIDYNNNAGLNELASLLILKQNIKHFHFELDTISESAEKEWDNRIFILSKIIKYNVSITHLSLKINGKFISDYGMKSICDSLEKNHHIQSISFADCLLTSTCIRIFLDTLIKHPKITSVDLSSNNFNSVNLNLLSKLLLDNPNIQELNIENIFNFYRDTISDLISNRKDSIEHFSESIAKSKTLLAINLSKNPFFFRREKPFYFLDSNQYLKKIDLSDNKIEYNDFLNLINLLKKHPNLNELNLANNQFTYSTIENIDYNKNWIYDFTEFLKENTKIEKIIFSFNEDFGMLAKERKSLCEFIQNTESIKKIKTIQNCKDNIELDVYSALAINKSITHLDYCPEYSINNFARIFETNNTILHLNTRITIREINYNYIKFFLHCVTDILEKNTILQNITFKQNSYFSNVKHYLDRINELLLRNRKIAFEKEYQNKEKMRLSFLAGMNKKFATAGNALVKFKNNVKYSNKTTQLIFSFADCQSESTKKREFISSKKMLQAKWEKEGNEPQTRLDLFLKETNQNKTNKQDKEEFQQYVEEKEEFQQYVEEQAKILNSFR